MPTWAEAIPKEDGGWRLMALSSKNPNGAYVRFSPVIMANNIAGHILHVTVNGSTRGLANPAQAYNDGTYTWYPCHIQGSGIDGEAQVWIAIEAYILTLGDYINNPPLDDMQFYDLDLLGQPTMHIPAAHMVSVVEVLHALASYLNAKL